MAKSKSTSNAPMVNRPAEQTSLARVGDRGRLKELLQSPSMQRSLAEVLPKHLTPERVAKMALIAVSRQPKLLECTQTSLLQAVMTSAQLGLDCSGALGSAYLVPFFNGRTQTMEAQFIAGYRGLIDLARRSGDISTIDAHCIYAEDEFSYEPSGDPPVMHVIDIRAKNRGEIIGAWARAQLKDGSTQYEVMGIEEIELIRDRSKAAKSGPWVTDFSEMAKKTVIRRLVKFLPLSVEQVQQIESMFNEFGKGLNYERKLVVDRENHTPRSRQLVDEIVSQASDTPEADETIDQQTGEVLVQQEADDADIATQSIEEDENVF